MTPALKYNYRQNTEYRIYIYIYIFFIKRISSCAKAGNSALWTIEDRVLKGFTKYSKRIWTSYTCRQGVPKVRTSEFLGA